MCYIGHISASQSLPVILTLTLPHDPSLSTTPHGPPKPNPACRNDSHPTPLVTYYLSPAFHCRGASLPSNNQCRPACLSHEHPPHPHTHTHSFSLYCWGKHTPPSLPNDYLMVEYLPGQKSRPPARSRSASSSNLSNDMFHGPLHAAPGEGRGG